MSTMRGAALVLVLWLVVLLASVVGAFALTARVEQLQGNTGVDALRAGQVAHASIDWAVHRLAQPALPGQPMLPTDGRPVAWQFAGLAVELQVREESAKVDINQADSTLLAALMRQLGLAPARANALAAAIVDWRDSDQLAQPGGAEGAHYQAAGLPYGPADDAFQGLEELRRVLGMDADTHALLVPYLTVWTQRSQPEPMLAEEVVLRAMGLDPALVQAQRQAAMAANGAVASRGDTFSIQSRVHLGNERSVVLRTVVRTGQSELGQMAYTVLQWQQGMGRQ